MKNHKKTILITGGTGSFGKKFLETIINDKTYKKIIIYSRDEYKQYKLQNQYPNKKYPHLRFFIGDVRDKERLIRACNGVDIIVHAAALKHITIAEYNPDECIKTNVIGAQNVIDAALSVDSIKTVVALSTDKAAAPVNLYGATKLVSDKLFIAANNIKGNRDLSFSVVRYGNVLGSRGSVIPFFLEKANTINTIPITHLSMTRFNMLLQDAVNMVLWVIKNAVGGEIFVPKLKSFSIKQLAKAISETAKIEVIGLRPGEKLHEEMITVSDSPYTIDIGNFYAILPPAVDIEYYLKLYGGEKVEKDFSYNSYNNKEFMNAEEIRALIESELK